MDASRALAVPENHNEIITSVTGKPAMASFGQIAPSSWGQTQLHLLSNRVVERSKWVVSSRECEVPLSEIDSVEIATRGNPMLLVLGFCTLALFGLGIVFIVLYFFIMKNRFLVIRSRNNAQIVCIRGDDAPARNFMQQTIAAVVAERAR